MSKKFNRTQMRDAMRLYAVTDRAWLNGRTMQDCVRAAIAGGATFVQLREKDMPSSAVLSLAQDLQAICAEAQVPFVINDNIELALECGADGVHLGQDDISCAEAREILGIDRIIGVSAATEEQAVLAEEEGADYIGVGALFPTPTKPEAEDVSTVELEAIVAAIDLPIVGIGGINLDTLSQLKDSGLDGVAVVSAIFAADDCEEAARELRQAVDEVL